MAIDRSLVCTSACVEENDGRVDDADEGRADAIKVAMPDDGRIAILPKSQNYSSSCKSKVLMS